MRKFERQIQAEKRVFLQHQTPPLSNPIGFDRDHASSPQSAAREAISLV
jgi:hypothetical protein